MRAMDAVALLFAALALSAGPPVHAQPSPPSPATTSLRDSELVPMLRRGGYVILLRHERTGLVRIDDDPTRPSGDCSAQRMLSPAGYVASAETGEIIRLLRIPIREVVASPMCRTMDTARFAFGRATPEPLLTHIDEERGRTEAVAGRELRTVVARTARQGTNVALVTHFSNLLGAYGVAVQEGQAAILGPDGRGGFKPLGTIYNSRWAQILRDEMAAERRSQAGAPR